MNDRPPLDLTSLGDVTSPDVIRGALRRFRRRVFTTGALVAVAALSVAGGLAWAALFHHTMGERVDAAPGETLGLTFTEGGVVTIVERVARLEDGFVIHLHLAAPDAAPRDHYSYRFDDVRYAEELGSAKVRDYYYVTAPPADGVVRGALRLQTGCNAPPGGGLCRAQPEVVQEFTIDLETLGVSDDVWEG